MKAFYADTRSSKNKTKEWIACVRAFVCEHVSVRVKTTENNQSKPMYFYTVFIDKHIQVVVLLQSFFQTTKMQLYVSQGKY
jgi:hypothetical protein